VTRTFTPDRVNADGSTTIKLKRGCNGCGTQIGDVTDQEMARGINGLPLPDVRKECPTCAPTAPEPRCLPLGTVNGDEACLDGECDHSVEPGADYCTNTSKHTVCLTHSELGTDGAITHAEQWPCQHSKAVAA
jgi:hypothetical protein